jgi:hypothetical protein
MSAAVPVCSRRRDWFRILRDLAAAGISMAEVGRKCGRSKDAVQGWSEGSEPKESDGRVVLALYAKHCPMEYLEHQRHFEIRVEMVNVTTPGENLHLEFAVAGAR